MMPEKGTYKLQYQNRGANVWIHQNAAIIWLEWVGFTGSTLYRETLESALLLAKTSDQPFAWVFDLRQMEAVAAEDIQWTVNDWLPRWETIEFREVLIIEPQKVFGKIATRHIFSKEIMQAKNIRFYLDSKSAADFFTTKNM